MHTSLSSQVFHFALKIFLPCQRTKVFLQGLLSAAVRIPSFHPGSKFVWWKVYDA